MLRKEFEPMTEEVKEGWTKQYNELYDLQSSPNNIKIIKSRRVR
jgi:hypothetical protein